MLVRWAGYDESHNQWVRRSVLEEDPPDLVTSAVCRSRRLT